MQELCKPETKSRVCILLSRILPTPLVFISGYANTENVFYCLNIVTFRPKNSKWDRNLQFTPLFKGDDEYPCHCYIGVQLSGSQTWWRNIFQCIRFGSEPVPGSQIVGKTRKKKPSKSWGGGGRKKENWDGSNSLRPLCSPQIPPGFLFVFALSQFSGLSRSLDIT